MERGFLFGVVGGVAVVATAVGVTTALLAAKDVQHTTLDPDIGLFATVDGHPAVEHTILQARIEGWYHPLPWVGREIHDVSCPDDLKAVVGATGTCTAQTDGERVSIPVRVIEIEGDPAKPRVTWKFER